MKLVTRWREMPVEIRDHLEARLSRIANFEQEASKLEFWLLSQPDIPDGEWFKDFHTFIVCGDGKFMKTFLDGDMRPRGTEVF